MNADATRTGHGNKRSRLQEKAILALLSAPTVEAAAHEAGVSKTTLLRWMRDDNFREGYRRARRVVVDGALTRLQAVTGDAVDALHGALGSGVGPVQVSAARTLLEFSFRSIELVDLEERLSQLEERVERKDDRQP